MNGWRGFLGGALALVALEQLTASNRGAGTVAGLSGYATRAVARFLDPHRPLWSDALLGAAPAPAAAGPAPGGVPALIAGAYPAAPRTGGPPSSGPSGPLSGPRVAAR